MGLAYNLERFRTDRGGAVAVVFGVSLLVLALTAGLAVDYGRAHATKTRLQNALDAAALAAARKAVAHGNVADFDVNKAVQDFFKADQPTNHHSSIVSVIGAPNGSGGVRAEAVAKVPTTFMQLTGIEELEIFATAEATFSMGNVEIALVLDTTASMGGPKLDNLKASAQELVDRVYENAEAASQVKISLVPFAQYVNVGLGHRSAPWMNVPNDYTETRNECQTVTPVISQSNCRMQTFTGYNDGVPFTYEAEICDYDYGPAEQQCNNNTHTYTWTGCVGSRNYPLSVQDGGYATRIPGIMNQACPSEIAPLTNDADAIRSSIDAMTPIGETYLPSGLVWGWRVLSPSQPYAQGADPNGPGRVRKYLVFMTDGENTRSARYQADNVHDHWGNDVAEANRLTAELCTNIKGAGIEIFTIAFDVTDNAVKDILRNCASAGFYEAANSSQLAAAFKNIAGNLADLRLAK